MSKESGFSELVTSVTEQFVIVLNAPVPFFLVVSAAVFAVWKVLSHLFDARLKAKDDLIALKQGQIDDYKDKLNGATPDAAKARIEALEARLDQIGPQLAALKPRAISTEQKDAMASHLDRLRGAHIALTADAASSDAASFSRSLASVFSGSGWIVHSGTALGIGNPAPSGIALLAENAPRLDQQEQAIYDALESVGFKVTLQKASASLPIPGPKTTELIITDRD